MGEGTVIEATQVSKTSISPLFSSSCLVLIDKAQIITVTMMQSKRNDAEADSENELKSSNNQFDDDRQGKLDISEK